MPMQGLQRGGQGQANFHAHRERQPALPAHEAGKRLGRISARVDMLALRLIIRWFHDAEKISGDIIAPYRLNLDPARVKPGKRHIILKALELALVRVAVRKSLSENHLDRAKNSLSIP